MKGMNTMAEEKVIYELRIIETDDGFRVEMKGDKERLKQEGLEQFMTPFGRGGHGPFGHRGPWRFFGGRFGRHHEHHHAPWGHRRWVDDEPQEERKSKEV